MGSPPLLRQPTVGQPIVAFDFDGTLTVRDSFTAFLRWRAGARGWAVGLMKLAPELAEYTRHRDRGRLKAAAVARFLAGASRADIERDAETFCADHWARLMRPDALACWHSWGERGAWRVIVTASPETTVAPFARRLAADALLGTPLVFDDQDLMTGAFETPNCRGAEKVSRLHGAYGAEVRLAAAYGDTSGDTEMLAIADAPGFRVFRERPGA